MEKYFGVTPDLDIEEQRAILTLKKAMAIDWKAVDGMIKRANYTFGGAHLRASGRLVEMNGRSALEFSGSGQRMPVKESDAVRHLGKENASIVARVEDWKEEPKLYLISEK